MRPLKGNLRKSVHKGVNRRNSVSLKYKLCTVVTFGFSKKFMILKTKTNVVVKQ